jgi:hypothetical protein
MPIVPEADRGLVRPAVETEIGDVVVMDAVLALYEMGPRLAAGGLVDDAVASSVAPCNPPQPVVPGRIFSVEYDRLRIAPFGPLLVGESDLR